MKNLKFVILTMLMSTFLNAQKESKKEFVHEININNPSIPGVIVRNEVIGKSDSANVIVSGQVLSKNENVSFANISFIDEKKQSVGTISDSEGNYKISIKPGKYTIKFYCSGYNKVSIQNLQLLKGETREIIVDLGIIGGNHTYYIVTDKELTPAELKLEQDKLHFD
ncbi:MAG: carboxypeptidase regulatory-like domain-containing protein [Bacteroidia bacterium]|nr:carboxypeptidase regulatory-like domain-containing protein [Bacteroidia bacterium]